MKKLTLVLACFISAFAFSQEHIVDVVMDGKPAKLNTKTGVFTFTKGEPIDYKNNQSHSTSNETHTVVKGETLYSISKKYGISMAQIKSINNLESNVLSVNQQLKIGYNDSVAIVNPSTYKVKKGDTLYSISKTTSLSIQELKQLNNLSTNVLSIGQELKLK